ncbi:MAG TPA: hypothetical protein VFC89_05160, partial [Oscillospiraceae bacterium]|nr:hypothetical protein [Oscillospiraceae bacterium]
YWEVYTITDLYKGIEAQDRIRLVGSPEDEGAAARNVGSEYLVFATVYELPVYPYPLINPIYNQAIFEVGGDGKLTFANNVEQQMLPAVFDEQFAADYRQIVTSSAGLTKKNPLVRVVNEYWDMSDLLTHSDLVVRVTFSEVEFINQYVSIGKVDKIIAEYGSVPTAKLPKTIGVNEDVKVGEEYLIFLQFDSQQDSLLLAARHGAIVDSSDGMRWNEVIHLLEEKS